MVTKCKTGGGVFLRNTNKKGLTLIELLAVIVILAIIALIATPIVTNIINDARKEAAKDSTHEYIKAIENKVALDNLDEEEYEDKDDYAYDEIKPDIKGTIPTGGIYSLKNGIVTEGKFCVNNYLLNYKESKIKVEGTCTNETLRLDGSLKLSSNSGNYTYPEVGTIDIIENKGNGKLSCESSDTKVATCLVKGNTVTVKSGTKEGSATLTITSEATSKYKEAKAAYLAYTSKGLLSITANGYNGIYDNKAHGITVSTGQNATVKYGEEEGTYDKDESPTYTDVGSYTVYYEVSQEGYNTVRGSKTVVITKADGEITLKKEKISIAYKDTKEIDVTKNKSDGNIKVEVLNKDIVEAEIKDNKIVITGKKLGTGKVKIISEATRNYKESSTEIEVTVIKANNTLKLPSTSGKYTYPESKTIEVEGNISGGLIKCVSADTKIANCTVNGNIITVKSGTKEGSTTLTITSEATENYNEQKLSYVAITAKGTLRSYTVAGYTGIYDSKEHGIVVTSSGSIVKYGTSEGTYNLDSSPKYTDVGEYTVYYKIETEGYNDITGNARVVITKAEGEMISPTAKTLTYTESEQELINRGSSNTGTIEYKLDNGEYSTSIPKATNPGTYKVYHRLVGDKNHKDIAESYITVTINKAVLSYTANGYTGVYDSNSHGIVVTSKGTIKYGETEGTYDKDESPKYADVGKYVVYFKITREGYYDITGSKTIEITKANNNIKLSSTSGKYTYPEVGTFKVIENPSKEQLYCESSDTKVATCKFKENIITVTPGTKEGSTTLTISTKGSKNYNAGKAAYVVITAKGTLRSYTVAGYNGVYDSKGHGIVVTSSGSTITYSKDGTNYTNENPKYTDVGEYIVYYKIETEGYNDITGTAKVVITKAAGTVVAPTSKTLTYTGTSQTLINRGSSSTGSIRYKLNDGSYSENLPQATNAGTYTVYYKVVGDSNHKDVVESSIKVTIEKATGQVTAPTAKTLAYTGSVQTLINAGSSSTGTIQYKLDNGSYSTTLPKATNPGTYKVYYKVVGDSNHKDVAESSINVTIDKAVNLIKLSSNVGTYTYPKSGTFEVTSNPSGGALTCISSNTNVATCSVSGLKITVTPGTKEGTATLTIKSAETTNYKAGQAAYVATTEKGLLSVTVNGYNKAYDGASHGIVVTSSGATIKYGATEGTYDKDESPTYKDVGEYTVYYQVTKAGYKTVTGSEKVVITKANGKVTAPTAKTLTYTETAQTLINKGSSSTGTIEYKLESGSYSTSLPQATNAGTYKVYYKVIGDKNHFDVSENSINVTIGKKVDTITVTAKTYIYDENAKTASFKTTSGLTPSATYYSEASCTTTVSSPTDAGVYYARATTIGNSNYSAGSLSCTKAITINKAGNTLLLSSNKGTYTYPNSGTFTVTKNISGGALSCSSSNTNVATCSVSGSTITVKPGTTKGTANITVTSASTINYNSQTSTHVATTEEGLLSVTASGYTGDYDSKEHGIVVTSSGSTIKYGTSEGTYNLDSSPKYKNLGTYTVYYQVTRLGYKTITGSKQVIIKDLSAPSTPTITNPTNGNWTNKDFSLTVSSSDNVGIAYYQYSYDNSNWTTYANSAATTYVTTAFSIERNQLVYIRACDSALNCSSSSSTYIRIDKTAPTVPSLTGTNTSWTNQNINVKPSSTDSGSGVNHYESYYSGSWHNYLSNDYFTSERNETVYFRACDNAGNCSGNASTEIHIDKTAPTKPTLSGTNENWTNQNVNVRPSSIDSGSGVDHYDAYYSGSWHNYPSNDYFNSERNELVYFRACDKAGNCSESSSTYIRIDKTTPSISINTKAFYNQNLSIYSVSYGKSGGATTCINQSDGNKTVSNVNNLGSLGSHKITCTATSNSGMKATATTNLVINGMFSYGTGLSFISPAYASGSSIIIPQGGIQYGPYIPVLPGCYQIWYNGNALNASKDVYKAYSGAGAGPHYSLINQNYISENSNYYLQFNSSVSDLETTIYNNTASIITVRDVNIWYIGTSC